MRARTRRGEGIKLLLAAFLILGGCASEERFCLEVPDRIEDLEEGKLEYPLGITWFDQIIAVANSNSRGSYCSGFLSLFSRDGETRGNIPIVWKGSSYSLFGEMRADPERGFLYLTERVKDALLVFSLQGPEPELIQAVPLKVEEETRGGADPFGLDVSPRDGTVAVTLSGTGEVVFYAPEWEGEGQEIEPRGRIDLGDSDIRPVRVRFSRDGNQAWVNAQASDNLYRLGVENMEVEAEFAGISAYDTIRARGLWVGADEIYVSTGYPQALLIFDPEEGLKNALPLGEKLEPYDMEVWEYRIYISSLEKNEVWVWDQGEERVVEVIVTTSPEELDEDEGEEYEYGEGPAELMLGPERGKAMITNYKSGDVAVLDLETLKIEKYFP